MHLCQEKNMNVRCPGSQTEQRESKHYLDLAEGAIFMLWGWEKILSAEVLESTDKNL